MRIYIVIEIVWLICGQYMFVVFGMEEDVTASCLVTFLRHVICLCPRQRQRGLSVDLYMGNLESNYGMVFRDESEVYNI